MGDFCRFFHIRTIPLAFRNANIYIYLFALTSALSLENRHHPCHMNALPVSHPHYPSPRTMSLPPLSKGGGLTASHKLSLCCVLLATRPPFYSLNFSAVKTEGLLYHPSLSTTSMPPLPKVRCCRPKKIGRLPEGLPHRHPSPLTNPPEPALSHA